MRAEVDAVLGRVARLDAAAHTLHSLVLDNEDGDLAPQAGLRDTIAAMERDVARLEDELRRASEAAGRHSP